MATIVNTGGNGGIKVASGTKTLASTATSITVETGETSSGKLLFAIIELEQPIYNQQGVSMAYLVKHPVAITGTSGIPGWSEAVLESRTNTTDTAGLYASGNPVAADISDSQIVFRPRTNQYPFFAGVYKWYAFYGEVYDE